MTTTTKKTLYAIIIPILMTTLTTISMEPNYPQFQLEKPKQSDIMHVNCSIMISDNIHQTIVYAARTIHTTIFEHNNLQSTIKDPVIIFDAQVGYNQFYLSLPAKYFVNFTDQSTLQIHETYGSKLFKSVPICKKQQLLINAVCKKNPKLDGNSFTEQFKNTMNNFYANPGSPWADQENTKELESAGIIKAVTTRTFGLVLDNYGLNFAPINTTTFKHGPNGCPNETALVKSIIDKKMPENKNILKSLMYQQINGSFPKKSFCYRSAIVGSRL